MSASAMPGVRKLQRAGPMRAPAYRGGTHAQIAAPSSAGAFAAPPVYMRAAQVKVQ